MPPRSSMAGFTLLPVILAMSLIAAIAFLLNRDNGMNAGIVAGQSDADRARYTAEAGIQVVNALSQAKNCTGYTNLNTTAFGAGSFTATITPASSTPVTLTATATTTEGAVAQLTRANVVMYQTTPYTLTLQPDAVGGKDTSLNAGSLTANYGALGSIKVQGTLGYRGLVQFDLSSIPAGSQITDATLQLSKTTVGAFTGSIAVYRVTTPWVEGTKSGSTIPDGATYSTSDGTTPWTTAGGGGDYDPAAVATLTGGGSGFNIWNVTSLVQGWRAGSFSNYGMILVPTVTVFAAFDSSDNGTAANNPKLVVTYLAPCGVAPPPPPPPPGTVVTLPAIADTWIDGASMGSNYGGSTSFTVTNAGKSGRGLVKFDLSSIPPGTLLTSATLRLYIEPGKFTPNGNPTSILTVSRVADSWTEAGATWKKRDGTNGWSAGFGSFGGFTPGPTSTSALSSTFTSGWVEWNITPLAQQWVDGVSPNYGAGVMIDTSATAVFDSRDYTVNLNNRPQLVITY